MKILKNKTYYKMLSENEEYHSFVNHNEMEKDRLREDVEYQKTLREGDKVNFEKKLKFAIDNPSKFKHGEEVVIIENGKKHKIESVKIERSIFNTLLNIAGSFLGGLTRTERPVMHYSYKLDNGNSYRANELKKPRVARIKTKQG